MNITPFLDKPTAIVGTTGAGKTFTAKGAVEQLLELGRRVIILDPTGAWWGLRSGADGSEEGGFAVTIFGGAHADVPISPTAEAGKALAVALAPRDVQAIIDTSEMTGGEKNRFLTPFLENLYALNKSALHLIVDEADEVAAQKLADGEQRLFGAFDKIVRRGRIKGFRPLMISQRPAVIHKNVLSQIGTLIALKLTSPQDRNAINDWVKGNADTDKAREVMSSLQTLKTGEGWVWSPAADVLERVIFPPIQTFDSSRTPEDGDAFVAPALTSVDVEALREAMKAPEEAQAPATAARGASKAEIEAADRAGYVRGYEMCRKDQHASSYRLGFHEAAKKIIAAASLLAKLEPDDVIVPALPADTPPQVKREEPSAPITKASPAPAPLPAMTGPADFSITPAKRRILAALRDLEAIGQIAPDKQTVAWFADASPKSSAYSNNLGALRSAGLIDYPAQGVIGLTDAGRAAEPPRGAPTHEHIMALVAGKLEPAQLRMLHAAVAAYPGFLTLSALADAIDQSSKSSSFSNNRGRLRSLGLIDYPSTGTVRAADLLFPEGKN